MRLFRVVCWVEYVASVSILQAKVNVSRTSRHLLIRFRHERRHKSMLERDLFHCCFEQARSISHLLCFLVCNSCFVHTRPSFCVPTLNVDLELVQPVESVVVKVLILKRAEQRVATHPKRQRLQIRVLLAFQRLGSLCCAKCKSALASRVVYVTARYP